LLMLLHPRRVLNRDLQEAGGKMARRFMRSGGPGSDLSKLHRNHKEA
jgi:hypothetical protein